MNNLNKSIWLAFLLSIFVFPTTVQAIEIDAQVRVGIGASDNIARTPQNELEETISTAGMSFSITEQTPRLHLDIDAQFDYLDYADDTFDEEWVGGLNADVAIVMIEERLRWVIQDNFGQALFDPFQPARPNNREDVNLFSTGPTFNLFPGTRNPVKLDLRYSRVDFEIRPNDNDRLSGTLSIGREVSRASTLSLNLNGTRIEYDNGVTAPIERYEAYLRFETTGAKNTVGFDLGYNEVEFAGRAGDGIVARVDYTRQSSADSSFSVSGGSQFSDQGDIFRFYRNITGDLLDTSDITDSLAPFQNNFFALSYRLEKARYSTVLTVDWNQEDYKDGQGIDRDIFRGNLRIQREVTRKVFAGGNVGFMRREFKYLDRRDDDLILGLDLGYRLSPGLDVSIEYQHFQRNSITPGADFTENRAFLKFAYTPLWSR